MDKLLQQKEKEKLFAAFKSLGFKKISHINLGYSTESEHLKW